MTKFDWLLSENLGISEYCDLTVTSSADLFADRDDEVERRAAILRMKRQRAGSAAPFPQPRGLSGRSPLFQVGELLQWEADQTESGAGLLIDPTRALVRTAIAARRDLSSVEVRRLTAGVALGVIGQSRTLSRPERTALEHLVSGLASSVWAERIEQVCTELAAGGATLAAAVTAVLERITVEMSPVSFTTLDFLADAMLALARIDDGDTVLDPAAGEATLILRAVDSAAGVRGVGYETDPGAWDVAVARVAIGGTNVDLGEGPRSLLRPDGLFLGDPQHRGVDVVLLDPPLENLVDWVTLAAREMRDGGRAVVAVPFKELVKPKGKQPLWRYLKPGTLEAVVVLPARQRTDTGEELALLVMSAGRIATGTLLVDARPMSERKGTRPKLDEPELARLRAALDQWGARGAVVNDVRAVVVSLDASTLLPDSPWPEPEEYRERLAEAVDVASTLQGLIDENGPLKGAATDQLRRALKGFVNVNTPGQR